MNEKEVTVDIGGINYVVTTDDNYLDEIHVEFEPEMVRLFQILAGGSEVILDVGANIGCTSILFSQLSRVVHAFEPSPSTYKLLTRNLKEAGCDNVFAKNVGLGSESGNSTLTFAPSNRAGGYVSSLTQASSGHTVENIEIARLDDIVEGLSLPGIDFVKIDVEGFEGHVLRGAEKSLAAYEPVVVLELNHWCLNAFQRTSIPEFFDYLRSTFPILLAVDGSSYLDLNDENDRYTVMYHHILNMRFVNIVASYQEERLTRFRDLYRHEFLG